MWKENNFSNKEYLKRQKEKILYEMIYEEKGKIL